MDKFELAQKIQSIIDDQLTINIDVITQTMNMAAQLPNKQEADLIIQVANSIGIALAHNKIVLPKDKFEFDFMESFYK